ncbi:MAG: hypothetical protein LBJ18_03745 [Rickettsiales bacterium]|jgi:hypothetical protein|nr:hypothetical protein [Rickettsiales bacterium]
MKTIILSADFEAVLKAGFPSSGTATELIEFVKETIDKFTDIGDFGKHDLECRLPKDKRLIVSYVLIPEEYDLQNALDREDYYKLAKLAEYMEELCMVPINEDKLRKDILVSAQAALDAYNNSGEPKPDNLSIF